MIRAIPSNGSDNIYCTLLAQSAVHGAMAGYTGFTVGPVNSRHAYIPISVSTSILYSGLWLRLCNFLNVNFISLPCGWGKFDFDRVVGQLFTLVEDLDGVTMRRHHYFLDHVGMIVCRCHTCRWLLARHNWNVILCGKQNIIYLNWNTESLAHNRALNECHGSIYVESVINK